MLSVRSQDNQIDSMRLVLAEVDARHYREDDAVAQVTGGDLVNATKRWTELVAQQANELVETKENEDENVVYTGGMMEAAAEALGEAEGGVGVGWDYEQDGKFKIGTHFK